MRSFFIFFEFFKSIIRIFLCYNQYHCIYWLYNIIYNIFNPFTTVYRKCIDRIYIGLFCFSGTERGNYRAGCPGIKPPVPVMVRAWFRPSKPHQNAHLVYITIIMSISQIAQYTTMTIKARLFLTSQCIAANDPAYYVIASHNTS